MMVACTALPVDVLTLGQVQSHPNAIVVDVKDAVVTDITWSQDGQVMGQVHFECVDTEVE